MQKQVVIEYTPEDLKGIIGVELLMDFGQIQINGKEVLEEVLDGIVETYEELLIEYTKKHQPELFDVEPIGQYSRIFPKGLSFMFKSKQVIYGSVTVVYPETDM